MTGDDDISDWEGFARYGDLITPDRDEHLRLLCSLVPATADEPFVAVDLGAGTGPVTAALLGHFPGAHVITVDNSAFMQRTLVEGLSYYAGRIEIVSGDLKHRGWLAALPPSVRLFTSSLAIHHLDGEQKRALYRALAARLEPGGALLFVDLVEPTNERAYAAYAAAWERVVARQAAVARRPDALTFFRDGWNHYAAPDLEYDKPSRLTEHLRWLSEAGLEDVDCFWLEAGHALYGGFKGWPALPSRPEEESRE